MMSHHALHHQSDSDLIAYVHQQLTDAQRASIDQHLETCLECRRRLLDHADLQHRLTVELNRQLTQASPVTGWSAIAPQVRKPRVRRKPGGRWSRALNISRRLVYATMAAVYVIVLLAGGFFLFTILRDFVRGQQTVSLVSERPAETPAPTPVLAGATIDSESVSTSVATAAPTPTLAGPPVWDGEGRVNLLVLGIDQRGNQEGYWRTDTMLIVTVDPKAQTVGMISVPRDLWVPIWGYDVENRINTAHYYGAIYDYPGGGPALARDTLAYNLGIPIHHFVRLNFTAFEKLIDEIGGIDIYVEKTINDPRYPDERFGYDPFYLSAGQHHLDGKTALKYARSRHGTGDFDRAKRQQQVILAARDQVIKLNQLPHLIANAPDILSSLGNSVQTDLTLDQAVQLARIVNGIPSAAYRSAVIDETYTQPYTTNTGAQVLIPLRSKIGKLYESFFEAP